METTEFIRKRKRFLLFFCLINFCTGGLYVWSIFAVALAAHFSVLSPSAVRAADLGPVFGLASALTPVLMIAGGIVNDRFGPKWVIGLGGVLLAVGYGLSSFAAEPQHLYWTYGALVGIGTGLINGCTINTAVKYFPERRGFAGGLVTAALGVGAAVLPFAAQASLDAFGITSTLQLFAVFSGVMIVPLALFLQPAPEGFAALMMRKKGEAASTAMQLVSKNWREMIASPTFVPLLLCFMTSATLGLMVISNASGIASSQLGLSAQSAAAAVSAISIANTAGRFVSGTLSDIIGRVPSIFTALVCALIGLGCLMNAGEGDAVLFFVGLAAVGFCFGAFIGIYPGLVADEFGPKHNSVNLSILFLGYSAGGFIGPYLIRSVGAYGSFQSVYFISIGTIFFGMLCALAYGYLKKWAAETKPQCSVL